MKVGVVGATGVLGRALVPLLVQQGHALRALARSVQKAYTLFPRDVEIMECDLLSPDLEERLPSLLKGCDAVVHIATAIPRDFTAPGALDATARLRTEGTERLLKASLEVGAERYIQQSITLAYPDHGGDWITEDIPLDSSPDRASICGPVIAMETMVREMRPDKLECCILRGGRFVGKGTFQERAIENLRARQERVPCDGSSFLSPIHVEDMASSIAAALIKAPPGSTFNIVDEPIRQGEYLDRLAALVGAPKPRRDPNLACPPSQRCSNEAAKAMLGWKPTHGIFPGK
jgi:nucleoside-diphosphate-sugar epimerase